MTPKPQLSSRLRGLKFMQRGMARAESSKEGGAPAPAVAAPTSPASTAKTEGDEPAASGSDAAAQEQWVMPAEKRSRTAPAGGHDAGNWDAWLISLSAGDEERPAAAGRRQQFGRWARHPKADAGVGVPRTESDDDDDEEEEALDTSDDGSDSFASAASSPNEAKPSKGGHGVGGDRGFKKPPSAASPPQRKRPAPMAGKGQGQRKKLAQGKRAPMR